MTSPNVNLAALLVERARSTPAAVALRATRGGGERTISFAALADRSARAAAWLHARGLRRGDAVLVFQPVSVELYVALLAIFRLGLQAMFCDPAAGRKHLARCCALQPPRAFLGPPRAHFLRLVSGALRRIELPIVTGCPLPLPGTLRWQSAGECSPREEIAAVAAKTPALLTFTSGSTGEPKAAVRTHGFLRAQHRALAESLALRAGEVDLATLPIFVLANLASGVTSILPDADLRRPGAIRVEPVTRQIRRFQPTRTAASPALLERLLEAGAPLHGFRKIYTGGAPVFPGLLTRLRMAAPDAEIVAVYGSTEAEPMAHVSARDIAPEDLAAMRGGAGLLAGTPVASVSLRVLPDRWGEPLGAFSHAEFADAACAPEVPGEIVVTGDHVLKGYLGGQGDRESKFQVDGVTWHRTGDAGYLDPCGRLWLLGRCAAKGVEQRGVQYPLAVEGAVHQLAPQVRRCAFLPRHGKRLLLIESAKPLSPGDIAQLQAGLVWSGLDDILQVPRIPVDRRHNAKIDYAALSEILR